MEIIYDMSDSEYHAITDRASASALNKMSRSPAHYKHSLDNPEPVSPAMKLGTLTHLAVLQPHLWSDYHMGPVGDRRTKKVKQEYQELYEEFGEEFVITPVVHEQVEGMCDSIHNHPIASQLLLETYDAKNEASIFWTDPVGVMCKARIDALPSGHYSEFMVDLKTTSDASPATVEKLIYNRKWYRQSAHYLMGYTIVEEYLRLMEATGDWGELLTASLEKAENPSRREFAFVVVEKDPPFSCCVYQLDDSCLEQGRAELDDLLRIWKNCMETGEYPAYSQEIHTVSLPPWAYTR